MLFITTALLLSSCATYLDVKGVAYQSIRSENYADTKEIPSDVSIVVYCNIDASGLFDVTILNNTDKVMTIDRTKTFFSDGTGNSITYYDPTIIANSQSVTQGNTTGGSVNLGAIAGAVGVGGALGTALSGVTVGGANSTATTNTNTTYVIDQPQIHIPPHGLSSLGRVFQISGIGKGFLSQAINSTSQDVNNSFTPKQTYASVNLCVSYSTDNETFETIVTDIYANSLLVSKVRTTGKVNDALRRIYTYKNDALSESWYLLFFESKAGDSNNYFEWPQEYRGNNFYSETKSFINYK